MVQAGIDAIRTPVTNTTRRFSSHRLILAGTMALVAIIVFTAAVGWDASPFYESTLAAKVREQRDAITDFIQRDSRPKWVNMLSDSAQAEYDQSLKLAHELGIDNWGLPDWDQKPSQWDEWTPERQQDYNRMMQSQKDHREQAISDGLYYLQGIRDARNAQLTAESEARKAEEAAHKAEEAARKAEKDKSRILALRDKGATFGPFSVQTFNLYTGESVSSEDLAWRELEQAEWAEWQGCEFTAAGFSPLSLVTVRLPEGAVKILWVDGYDVCD